METMLKTGPLHGSLADSCPNNLSGMASNLFLTLINTLMATQCYFNNDRYPPDYGPKLANEDTYDFIVVGGGTAGSVVAGRLSENPDWKVLVLEAGGYPSSTSEIPSLLFSLQDTDEDWKYRTEPSNNYCLSVKEGKCRWPRGKVLGGCSSINAMLYVRGNKRDYDNWAKMGNPGWDYDSVLPYFKMSERIESQEHKYNNEYGDNGPLPLNVYDADQPITKIIREAAEQLGYPSVDVERPLGYLNIPMTIQKGERVNAAKAFLGNNKNRTNLHVALKAYVTKIIIDQATMTAKGVKLKIGDKDLIIYASREVILSAGAINTPQLLMLSGIGPKKHLDSLEIPTLIDLKVGENLQDHLHFPSIILNIDDSVVRALPAHERLGEIYKYFMYRTGELGQISITNFIGFINTKRDSEYPNLQIHHILNMKADDYLLPELMRCADFIEEFKEHKLSANQHNFSVTFEVTLINPKSRGKVLLNTTNPHDPPLIYPNYFADESDIETFLEGIRYIEKLTSTEPFKEAKPKIVQDKIPNCDHHEFRSDEYWKCALKNTAITLYHPTGTAKMGPRSDPSNVVGPDLLVHGIKNLRIADASIMPEIISGNTNAPVIMIGQKAAAMIKEKWQPKHDEL